MMFLCTLATKWAKISIVSTAKLQKWGACLRISSSKPYPMFKDFSQTEKRPIYRAAHPPVCLTPRVPPPPPGPYNVQTRSWTMRIDKVKWITARSCGKQEWHSFASINTYSIGWKGKILELDIASQNMPLNRNYWTKIADLGIFFLRRSYFIHWYW